MRSRRTTMWMAGAGSVFVSLLLHLSVALGETDICAFKGSVVDLNCSITPISSKKWFTANWNGQQEQYDNLKEVSGDTNRLMYNGSEKSSSTLTIHDVNESDVNTYLCLADNDHSEFNSSRGISLRVADLQVHAVTHATNGSVVTLTCGDNCTIIPMPTFSFYKNNKLIQSGQNVDVNSDASFSCAVTGHDHFRSPAVCVNTDGLCWRVNYINREICALTNTSVEISSDYSYPSGVQVTKAFWYTKWIEPDGRVDIHSDANYSGRFEYRNTTKHHKLILKNLTSKDSAEYKFRFQTTNGGKYSGDPGVILNITALTVTVSPATTVTEGQRVTLCCTTSCPLSGFSPIYIWYQNNGFLEQNQHNYVTLDPVLFSLHAGNYSCAVKDRESSRSPEITLNVRYRPKTPLVSVSPSGEIEEGSSVTLTCSSDANPPVNKYVWYKKSSMSQNVTTSLGQNYVMNISLEDGGEYYCTATNEVGTSSPTIQLITVTNKGTSRAGIIVAAVIAVSCLFLFLLIYLGIRMRKYRMSVTEPHRGSVPRDPIQRGQRGSVPDRGNISATPTGPSSAEQTQTRGPQDDVNYSTVHFSRPKNQEVPQHSNDQTQRDEGDVQYATVNVNKSSASPRSSQGQATDVSDVYATVN